MLSQKLERAEARANASFVESRARIMPEAHAKWMEVKGTYVMFDGANSPLTQTFGLGLFGKIEASDLKAIESFYRELDAPICHEVSPMADQDLIPLLNSQGYQPSELTNVMYLPLNEGIRSNLNAKISTRMISRHEADHWAAISARGWSEMEGLGDFMFNFGKINANCTNASPFLAEMDGEPIATGMLFICGEVALLAGASTIPEARGRGAQNALLQARLKYAADQGCTLAVMAAEPGSQSQKNSQKHGFLVAYTRTKWKLSKM